MKKKPIKKTPLKVIFIVAGIILLMQVSTWLFAPSPEEDAWGKIILPENGSRITSEMVVVGDTQDIARGHFIWIAISPENQNLCLPEKRVLRNTRFKTTFNTGGVKSKAWLELYILDEKMHQTWTKWLENKNDAGVPCPKDIFRLDMVQLIPES